MNIDNVLAKAKEQGNGKLMTLIRDNTYDFEFVK